MNTFFVDSLEESLELTGENHNHLKKSLRMRPGERVKLSDGKGSYGEYVITEITDKTSLKRDGLILTRNVPVKMHLYQGLPKKKKLETIAQKCTEIGISKLTPVMMKYSQNAKTDPDRLEKIVLEAAKQSGEPNLPQLEPVKRLDEVAPDEDLVLVCYEKESKPLKEILEENPNPKSIAVFIGPEGGFDEEEVKELKKHGALSVSLGENILRTETAGPAVLSVLHYVYG